MPAFSSSEFPSCLMNAKLHPIQVLICGIFILRAEDIPKSALSFSLKEIKAITNNYKTLIGKGGFGSVYRGKLPDGE
ncbi:hypothetical protein Mapa_013424 [Marchantia paleacea]|nr:hypothetical protein Mapa_013424 [Marchantia paleacea]